MDITVDLYGETGIVDATDQTTTADTNHLVNKQPEKVILQTIFRVYVGMLTNSKHGKWVAPGSRWQRLEVWCAKAAIKFSTLVCML